MSELESKAGDDAAHEDSVLPAMTEVVPAATGAHSGSRKRGSSAVSGSPPKRRRLAAAEESKDDAPPSAMALLRTVHGDSRERAEGVLQWLLSPMSVDAFFKEHWESQPMLIQRDDHDYYDGWLTTKRIRECVAAGLMRYGEDLDLAAHVDGVRSTHNGEGVATAEEVWKAYDSGCSVRLTKPQQHVRPLWRLLSALEEAWGSFAGCNAYLTPAGKQGFSPHYDDIEAFVMQLEGCKAWRVYAPRGAGEILPRYSSGNFEEGEVGEPILDVILRPGDLLYMPRGFIHQARSCEETHSLHITVSTGLHSNWCDVLRAMFDRVISQAAARLPHLRSSPPRDYLSYMGVQHADVPHLAEERQQFGAVVSSLLSEVMEELPLDEAADEMGKRFLHDRLPLPLAPSELACMSAEAELDGQRGKLSDVTISAADRIRLPRAASARLMMDGDQLELVHLMNNSRVHHGRPVQSLTFSVEYGPALELVLASYPACVAVGDLPVAEADEAIALAEVLFREGIVLLNPAEELAADEVDAVE
eukprot:PLAT772.1.p1 GENE.PLAT772.1~~PLAT772.1.p1  ORF type:complete len:549 (-),score=242.69 PLAT772.1:41-1633(-)